MKKVSVVVLVLLLVSMVGYGYAPGHWENDSDGIGAWTTGRVGIGTSSPINQLHVQCNSSAPSQPEYRWAAIYGYNTATDYGPIGVYGRVSASNGKAVYGYNGNSNGFGGFFVGKGYFSGNVGIGTTNLAEKLNVNGNTKILGRLRTGGNTDGTSWNVGITGPVIQRNGNVVLGIGGDYKVGIGTTNPGSYKLAVNGTIRAKEIKVETGWSDFVFSNDYKLMPLDKLEKHIKANKSLPGIPTEKEVVENGVNLGEMQAKFLEKIEELTLYVIELKKEIEGLKKENEEFKQNN